MGNFISQEWEAVKATEREKEKWDTNKKDNKTSIVYSLAYLHLHFHFFISVLDLYTYWETTNLKTLDVDS